MANGNDTVEDPLRTDIKTLSHELWWMGMIEGVLAIFFGVTAIFWPGLTLATLVYLFGAFVLGVGVVQLLIGLTSIRSNRTWWLNALVGAILLGAGVYLIRHPRVTFATFILVIGLTLIARGILDAVRIFSGRSRGSHRVLGVLGAAISVIVGIIILAQPAAGGVAFVWLLGLYALIIGSITITLSLELRNEWERLSALAEPLTSDRERRKVA